MPATGGGVHAADPGAEGEADDDEGAAAIGFEGTDEHLLEAGGHAEFVFEGAGPDRGFTGGAGREREHGPERLAIVPAQAWEGMLLVVVLLGRAGDLAEVVERAHGGREDAVGREKLAVGGDVFGRAVEQGEDAVLGRAVVTVVVRRGVEESGPRCEEGGGALVHATTLTRSRARCRTRAGGPTCEPPAELDLVRPTRLERVTLRFEA